MKYLATQEQRCSAPALNEKLNRNQFAGREAIGVRLDSWGKTLRFLAASATFWVAVFTLIVGTAKDWGGSSGSW